MLSQKINKTKQKPLQKKEEKMLIIFLAKFNQTTYT